MSETAARTIVFIHGHHFKPSREQLAAIWVAALRAGIERDYPDKAVVLDTVTTGMAYFGDLTNALLQARGQTFDEQLDVADRRNALATLRGIAKPKKFKRYEYQQLPGKTALKELLADVGSPLLATLGLEKPAIAKLMPELSAYWDAAEAYGEAVRDRVRATLREQLQRPGQLMVVAHGMGAVVAYDVLWELSRTPDGNKVDVLLTMGCPLGNPTVQKKLAGHGAPPGGRYPANILVWNNVAAEDDYVNHDKTVADDFRAMMTHRLISSINDFRIYNLAVRYGRSNPHSSVGYLIHPRIARMVSDWL